MKQFLTTQCVKDKYLTLIPVNFTAKFGAADYILTLEIWQWSVGQWRLVPRASDRSADAREAKAVAKEHLAISKS